MRSLLVCGIIALGASAAPLPQVVGFDGNGRPIFPDITAGTQDTSGGDGTTQSIRADGPALTPDDGFGPRPPTVEEYDSLKSNRDKLKDDQIGLAVGTGVGGALAVGGITAAAVQTKRLSNERGGRAAGGRPAARGRGARGTAAAPAAEGAPRAARRGWFRGRGSAPAPAPAPGAAPAAPRGGGAPAGGVTEGAGTPSSDADIHIGPTIADEQARAAQEAAAAAAAKQAGWRTAANGAHYAAEHRAT